MDGNAVILRHCIQNVSIGIRYGHLHLSSRVELSYLLCILSYGILLFFILLSAMVPDKKTKGTDSGASFNALGIYEAFLSFCILRSLIPGEKGKKVIGHKYWIDQNSLAGHRMGCNAFKGYFSFSCIEGLPDHFSLSAAVYSVCPVHRETGEIHGLCSL